MNKYVDEKWFYTNPTSVSFKWLKRMKFLLEREHRQKASDGESKEKDNTKWKSLLGSCEPKKKV